MRRSVGSIETSEVRWKRHRAFARLRALVIFSSVLALLTHSVVGFAAGKPFWRPELAPAGPMVMLVSLDEQRIYVYRNGVAIGESRISSGRRGHETPTGVYTILQKERQHRSNLYENAPMPFMQRLSWDGLALHAGVLPGHPASHGCIRLPEVFAEHLFEVSPRGTIVVVSDKRVAAPEINHPATIAPLGLGGMHPGATGGVDAPWPGNDGGPVSIVASTHDHALFVLQSGRLIARTTLGVPDGYTVGGMLLYVRRVDTRAHNAERDGGSWSAYRILGKGVAPAPRNLAAKLKMPDAFGAELRERITMGTTVLVTDLPAWGGQPVPYGTLLEAQEELPLR